MASTTQFKFRHIFYVFAMAMCHFHQMGVACRTINGTLSSCFGKCGNVIMVPCSCDVTCAVLNKCCEDFADTCPLEFTQAMDRFPHLMNATVVCSEDSFFMIMSCPRDFEGSQDRENHQLFTQVDTNYSVSLLDIVKNAPVADLSTGFIFKNSEIYSCNGAKESQMTHFEIEIGLLSYEPPTSYLELNSFLDFQKIAYAPSALAFSLVSNSACLNAIVMTCGDGRDNVSAETVDKCENGMFSYVRFQNTKYKNRYCLFCRTGQMEKYTEIDTWIHSRSNFQLSIIPSLTNDGGTLKAVLKEHPYIPTVWKELECDIHENEQTSLSTPCDLKQCGHEFQFRPYGQCARLHDAVIGVPDDGYDFSQADKSRLPDLISCFLKEHLDVDVVYTDPQTSHGCDGRLKRAVYLVTGRVALVDFDTYYFIFPKSKMLSNTIKFSALMKAFLRYRMKKFLNHQHGCSVHPTSCYQGEDVDPASECRSMVEGKSTFQTFTSYKLNYPQQVLDPAVRGVIVDNATTALCLKAQPINRDELHIDCWEEPLYENDLNLISEYMDSKCFSVFEMNRANVYGVSLWLVGCWLLYSVVQYDQNNDL